MCKNNFLCKNCGSCCGPVLLSVEERKVIDSFLSKHPKILKLARRKPFSLTCVFRDENKCLIYEARPTFCRAYQCNNSNWDLGIPPNLKDFNTINEIYGNQKYSKKQKKIISIIVKNLLN